MTDSEYEAKYQWEYTCRHIRFDTWEAEIQWAKSQGPYRLMEPEEISQPGDFFVSADGGRMSKLNKDSNGFIGSTGLKGCPLYSLRPYTTPPRPPQPVKKKTPMKPENVFILCVVTVFLLISAGMVIAVMVINSHRDKVAPELYQAWMTAHPEAKGLTMYQWRLMWDQGLLKAKEK